MRMSKIDKLKRLYSNPDDELEGVKCVSPTSSMPEVVLQIQGGSLPG